MEQRSPLWPITICKLFREKGLQASVNDLDICWGAPRWRTMTHSASYRIRKFESVRYPTTRREQRKLRRYLLQCPFGDHYFHFVGEPTVALQCACNELCKISGGRVFDNGDGADRGQISRFAACQSVAQDPKSESQTARTPFFEMRMAFLTT
jgi:hypothetical protein